MDKIILATVADCLINLGAGWFGVAIILPVGLREFQKRKIDWKVLTVNIFFGILSLIFAILFRTLL